LSGAENGKQDDVVWNNSEQSGEGGSYSEIENSTEKSRYQLFDYLKDRKECACSETYKFIFNSCIFSVTFPFKYVLNIFLV
jgi:hypothetical protein